MARKKEPPKPLFSLKFDFVASLDNVCHEAIMLMQVVDSVIHMVEMPQGVKDMLIERAKAMRAALSNNETEQAD